MDLYAHTPELDAHTLRVEDVIRPDCYTAPRIALAQLPVHMATDTHTTSISLAQCTVTGASMTQLCDAILDNPASAVEALTLIHPRGVSGDFILGWQHTTPVAVFDQLARLVRQHHKLRKLRLEMVRTCYAGHALFEALKSPDATVEEVSFVFIVSLVPCADALLEIVRNNMRLKTLKLIDVFGTTRMHSGWYARLFDAIGVHSTLQHLDLSYNAIASNPGMHDMLLACLAQSFLSTFECQDFNSAHSVALRGRIARIMAQHYRTPHVRWLVRMRALCMDGRARVAVVRDTHAAWLCERAPLWVAIRVCALLRAH